MWVNSVMRKSTENRGVLHRSCCCCCCHSIVDSPPTKAVVVRSRQRGQPPENCAAQQATKTTSDSSTVHVSWRRVSALRVNEFHATPSSFGRSREDLMELLFRITRYKKWSFTASAPLTWNSLPTTVRDVSISMNSFSGRWKDELFCRAYGTDLVPMWQLSSL